MGGDPIGSRWMEVFSLWCLTGNTVGVLHKPVLCVPVEIDWNGRAGLGQHQSLGNDSCRGKIWTTALQRLPTC
jgi:hypothetical protein